MASKGKKTKKPLETTLGKASKSENDVDLSNLRQPIETSISGLREVLSLYQKATEEVKNYITFECDIMYECRTCRSIFRSLANFILHKRNYCKERFNLLDRSNNNDTYQEKVCITDKQSDNCDKKGLNPVIEKLVEKQKVAEIAQEILQKDLSVDEESSKDKDSTIKKSSSIILEKIASNKSAVFQTLTRYDNEDKPELVGNEVMELHKLTDNNMMVTHEGKISQFDDEKISKNPDIPKSNLVCTECDMKFSSKKTLTYHIKYKHNRTQTVYICPDCKDSFANAWCVYRHLLKVHRKSTAQIRRLREQIHNSCIKREMQPKKKHKEVEKLQEKDEENQWLNNMEDDSDLQMCGGCGKRFERKAALHSHSAMCAKRIAVCNQIKENNAKKKEEQLEKAKAQKGHESSDDVNSMPILKGALKRKPSVLRLYERRPERMPDISNHAERQHTVQTEEGRIVNQNRKSNEVDNQEVIENISLLSDSEDEKLSPTKQCFDKSMKIDTEKMFNIIGVPKDTDTEYDQASSSEEKLAVDHEIISEIENTDVSFDDFCKKVSQRRESLSSKSSSTKILDDYKNVSESDEDDDDVILISDNLDEICKNPRKLKTPVTEGAGSVSVVNLESLIGISPEKYVQNQSTEPTASQVLPTSQDTETESHNESVASSIEGFVGFPPNEQHQNIVFTSQVDIPEQPEKTNPMKRKRGISFDDPKKLPKNHKSELDELDVSFMSKASEYMNEEGLKCIPCNATYTDLTQLLWHMSAHFSWFRFQCTKCSFVSFNKLDCVFHAENQHKVTEENISAVVLPIPNWKTVLMSHDFCYLQDQTDDLTGKHTDEIIISDEQLSNDANHCNNSDPNENLSELFTDFPDNADIGEGVCSEKPATVAQNQIDISESYESHKLNGPTEIPPKVSEIIKNTINDEEVLDKIHILLTSPKVEITDDYEEDDNYFLPDDLVSELERSKENNNEISETIRIEISETFDGSDNGPDLQSESDEISESSLTAAETEFKTGNKQMSSLVPIINVRPARNRIKTYQNDFLYDLNSVFKSNKVDSNVQKQRKCTSSPTSPKSKLNKVCKTSNSDVKPVQLIKKKM